MQFCVHKKYVKNIYKFDTEDEAKALWKSHTSVGDYTFTKPSEIDGQFLVFESDFAGIMIKAFLMSGEFYGVKVPTVGECMAGFNWLHTH